MSTTPYRVFDFTTGTVSTAQTLFPTSATARVDDPDTSLEAGKRQDQSITSDVCKAMLEAFVWRGGAGWTQEELARDMRRNGWPQADSTIRRRFRTLENGGLIIRSNKRRDTSTQCSGGVYMLATFCNCDGNALREKWCPAHGDAA